MESQRRFPGTPESVADARRFIADALPHVPQIVEIQLMVSELATNAVLHARSDYLVTISFGDGFVRVTVRDYGCSGIPLIRPESTEREDGRGLALVDLCSSLWGAEAADDGTVVWFDVNQQAAA